MLSHEQGVKNNQIQLLVDPEVSSKEAVLKRYIHKWIFFLSLNIFFFISFSHWWVHDIFTFFPLPQTSQPVTFPEGSLAQEGNDPWRPRWLVSWRQWLVFDKLNSGCPSNYLEFSTRCPQVLGIFISASINVWPINPMSNLVQLLPESILWILNIVARKYYLVWRPHFKLGEERLRAKFMQVFFP